MSTPAQTPAVPRCQKCNGLVAVKALVTAGGDLNELFWECDDCEHHWFAPLPLVAELARQRDAAVREWYDAIGKLVLREHAAESISERIGIAPEVVRAILGTEGRAEGDERP